MRRIWLPILAILCLTACQPIQYPLFTVEASADLPLSPPLNCEHIMGEKIRSVGGDSSERDHLPQWVEESFQLDRTQIEVLDLNAYPDPLDKWFITWDAAGITYQITVGEGVVSRVGINFPEDVTTVQEVINCIGETPEYYVAEYILVEPPETEAYYQSMFDMLLPELGLMYGVWHEQRNQPFSPQVSGSSYVSSIVYVKPGSPLEVYNRAFGFPDNRIVSPPPQPWPKNWEEIEFADKTGG